MDAYHYDKIADKLIQFHSKIPQEIDLEDKTAKEYVRSMRDLIMRMLHEVEQMADWDNKGWIR